MFDKARMSHTPREAFLASVGCRRGEIRTRVTTRTLWPHPWFLPWGRSLMGRASQTGQERVGIYAQDGGQGEDVEQGNIALSTFH